MMLLSYENPYGDDKVYDACGLIGIMDVTGRRFSGHDIVKGIVNMEERGNGLGAGFAVYGCYPEHADCYAFHVMYTEPDQSDRGRGVSQTALCPGPPRRGAAPAHTRVASPAPDLALLCPCGRKEASTRDEAEYVVAQVMEVNTAGWGAYIYSSGKNMGVFKGVGFPEQIAEYFGIAEYTGYLWTAHTRFPTNTPGWWGGAHPFGLLDWTVVHNGEISSYGTNRRYLEMQGITARCRPTPRSWPTRPIC